MGSCPLFIGEFCEAQDPGNLQFWAKSQRFSGGTHELPHNVIHRNCEQRITTQPDKGLQSWIDLPTPKLVTRP